MPEIVESFSNNEIEMNARDNNCIILTTVLLKYIDFHNTLVSISPTSIIELQ